MILCHSPPQPPPQQPQPPQYDITGSPSVNIQGRKYNSPSVPGSAAGVGDIKTKLANMGAAAKRNLNNLAISFSRRARQNPNALNAQIRDEREASSLMNYFEDKPDYENTDEIITFEQVRNHCHCYGHDDVATVSF